MACLIIQQEYATHRIPQIAPLDLQEFKLLIDSLQKVTDLDRRVEMGYTADKSEYIALLPAFDTLTTKMRKWRALASMATAVARNAGDKKKSLVFLEAELDLIDPNNPRLSSEREEIQAQIAKVTDAFPSTEIQKDRGDIVRRLVGVSTLTEMKTPPLVAVVGGAPLDGILPERQCTVLHNTGAGEADRTMGEYIGTVVQAVRLIAPDCNFLFDQPGAESLSDAQLLKSINALVDKNPSILLVTLGPLKGPIYEQLIQSIAS